MKSAVLKGFILQSAQKMQDFENCIICASNILCQFRERTIADPHNKSCWSQ
jgi:hypothetical protein